jgi:hypothetical protein
MGRIRSRPSVSTGAAGLHGVHAAQPSPALPQPAQCARATARDSATAPAAPWRGRAA